MKILHSIIVHLLIVFFTDYSVYICIEFVNYVNKNSYIKQMQQQFETQIIRHFSMLKILDAILHTYLRLFYATDVLNIWPCVAVGWGQLFLETIKSQQTCKMLAVKKKKQICSYQ